MREGVRRALVVVGGYAVLLGAVLAGGWAVTHPWRHSVGGWDNTVARDLADHRSGGLTDVADVGTLIGETITGIIVLAVVGLLFCVWKRSWRPGLFLALMYGGMGLVYLVATHVDPRPRPPVHILDAGLAPDASYPSGHTGTAASIAACLAILLVTYRVVPRPWAAVLVLVPVFTALSRLYLGAHHVTDVLATFLLAPVWALVVASQVWPGTGSATGPATTLRR